MTPAQASGHPSLQDVPVQGPTDPGMREADCWFAQNRIPKTPACVDCEGSSTMSNYHHPGLGYALAMAGDPSVLEKLTQAQQTWVSDTLIKLNSLIVAATKTTCPTFGQSFAGRIACFQQWYNKGPTTLTKADGSKFVLRTDGTLDQETLTVLIGVAGLNAKDFPVPFPGMTPTAIEKKGLSKGAMWGIGLALAAVGGGAVYYATRKKTRRGGKRVKAGRRSKRRSPSRR
jgi:hypothetical protein